MRLFGWMATPVHTARFRLLQHGARYTCAPPRSTSFGNFAWVRRLWRELRVTCNEKFPVTGNSHRGFPRIPGPRWNVFLPAHFFEGESAKKSFHSAPCGYWRLRFVRISTRFCRRLQECRGQEAVSFCFCENISSRRRGREPSGPLLRRLARGQGRGNPPGSYLSRRGFRRRRVRHPRQPIDSQN